MDVKAAAEKILGMCTESGKCLLWPGRMRRCQSVAWDQGTRTYVSARRVVLEAAGRTVKDGTYPVMRCRQNECLKLSHIILMTRSELHQLSSSEGRYSNLARKAATVAARRAGKNIKINIEIARHIRAKEVTQREYVELYGISRAMVQRIQAGTQWREQVAGTSIFNLAGAGNGN